MTPTDPSPPHRPPFSLAHEDGVTRRFALLSFLQDFAVWLPLPVLVLHLLDRGLDLTAIGVAFALRAVLVAVLEVPTGGLADAIGRKPVALASQAATLVSFGFLLIVAGPWTLALYAVFQGVGSALHSGALDAWYIDTLKRTNPEKTLQRHLATVGVARTGATLVGAAVGGALPTVAAGLDLPWPLADFGVALAAGVAFRGVVLALTAAWVVEPTRPGRVRWRDALATPTIVRDGFALLARTPVLPYLLLGALAMGVALGAVETLWQPMASLSFGAEPGASLAYSALGFVIGAGALLGSVLVMRFGDRVPGGPAALAGVAVLAKGAGMVLLAMVGGAAGVATGLGLTYVAMAVHNVPHDALVNEAVPDERRSVLLSLDSLAVFAGVAIGYGVLGPVADIAGPSLALLFAAFVTVASALAYVRVARRVPAAVVVPAGDASAAP